ncbi:hypothetical protein ABBQ38_012335 [Trebouxia sp. C0009 RCD-2024]
MHAPSHARCTLHARSHPLFSYGCKRARHVIVSGVANKARDKQQKKSVVKVTGITQLSNGKAQHFGSAGNPIEERHEAEPNTSVTNKNITDVLKGLILPVGYPDSVTPDYLAYQLWAVPAHITGWMGSSLITSSLLAAVGLKAGAGTAAAGAASIRWITKDGLGAIGRLLVSAGRGGTIFDEDPKRWRLIAEGFTTTGRALEIATAVFPQNFVLLAGLGNFTKAVGKGMGGPCFRIIQTHFARQNNVGDVAAKEQVWEVVAQLIGLGLSIALLNGIEATGDPTNAVWAWVVIQSVHVVLRFKSLGVVQFPSLNQKRSCVLINAFLEGQQLPDVRQGNAQEVLLADPVNCTPRVQFGCTVSTSFDASNQTEQVLALAQLYNSEQYMLIWRDCRGQVLLQDTAAPIDMLRALWQAGWLAQQGIENATEDNLQQSVNAMQNNFDAFLQAAQAAGWDTSRVVIRSKGDRFTTIADS